MGYFDKYNYGKGQNRRSIFEILALDDKSETFKSNYVAEGIDTVKIGGDTFKNYGAFQFAWEKSYQKSPERSAGGVIGNLNAHTTFRVPHLIINFSVLSIDDYRALIRKDLEQNEFVVECYDPIYNKPYKGKMYFATPEMAKLRMINRVRLNGEQWEDYMFLYGVENYTVELIGTNADLDLLSVVYHLNPPKDTGATDFTYGEDDVYSGQDIVLGQSATEITTETFNGKYSFAKWARSGEYQLSEEVTRGVNNDGAIITINEAAAENGVVHFYALWQSTETHTLSLSYGIAETAIDEETKTYIRNKLVTFGSVIGELPSAPDIKAKATIDGVEQEVTTHYNGAWYKTPVRSEFTKIDKNTPYWLFRDGTAYLLYEVVKNSLTLFVDGKEFSRTDNVEYNTPTNLPLPVSAGKKFDGWYTTKDFKSGTKFTGNMPAFNLTLYGRFVDKEQ